MAPHVITVYHNISGRFAPYEPGHDLVGVITHHRDLPEATHPEHVADFIFDALNADLDDLHQARANTGGESTFLLVCTYRLLALRSLTVGDVVGVAVGGRTTWLACEPVGWRRISTPTVSACPPLGGMVSRRLWELHRG
jgi:hypothetical protein